MDRAAILEQIRKLESYVIDKSLEHITCIYTEHLEYLRNKLREDDKE